MIKTTTYEISKELQTALEKAGYQTNVSFSISPLGSLTNHYKGHRKGIDKRIKGLIPCFTMSELWDMLPQVIKSKTLNVNMYLEYGLCGFRYDGSDEHDNADWSDNKLSKDPCNALAKLAIWCIENGHALKLEKI